ncbi:methylated-DNA--[protein]-cysteine S-methyltransferase [Macrococcus armenti]|uniref:methylated-DNA--[protein]-cysteine S-methyltransferase n=1 Tax=Macrococcus armenti TaxID=2875764 RepID=UPI001CCF2529|nr:methylated-DNA--[protein]-cysteine S-methyltransferase [Macrococcus armenti]UBH22810.1 methylated-DNA--[protein]-cysteine S-methyltransferase [Macrococcus armenti]
MNHLKVYITHFLLNDTDFIIASNASGVIYLANDDTMEYLNRHIERFYSEAVKVTGYEADQLNARFIEDLRLYFKGELKQFNWPLNLAGTDFQKKIWSSLCNIPYGTAVTYSEIASLSGNKQAVRAVGGAVGANPVMIVVPCHRVIGKNGELTGFSGGLDMKRTLLAIENIKYIK